jgi:predicted ATP-grasp superfamily ATP-dependent carboligase
MSAGVVGEAGGEAALRETRPAVVPILLVATATTWLGTARLPRALARAGFDVALLAPANSLAEKSRYVARLGRLPDNATPLQWVYAFAAMVKATSPRIVVPCDDMSFTLMQDLALSPPAGVNAVLQLQWAALVRESIGDPVHYRESTDKTLLPQVAAALGVRMPPQVNVSTLDQARAFVASAGFPIVLKQAHGFAGRQVAICRDDDALARAFATFSTAVAGGALVVQAHIAGPSLARTSIGWRSRELAGITRERLMRNPPETGPPTVGRFHRDDEVRARSQSLIAGLGLTGFCAIEYVRDATTGELFLLEINRRVTPGAHAGALRDAIAGLPASVPNDLPPGFDRIIAQFPQEWLRDPGSDFLRRHPVDAPWDEPELFEAMLAMRDA